MESLPRLLILAAMVLGSVCGCVERSTEHRIRANALFKSGEYQQALAECERGLEAKPDDPSLWVLKGKTAFELEQFGGARSAYERAIVVGSGRSKVFLGDAYLGLAVIATREQNWTEARTQFLRLLELNPADGTSHINLAKVALELGRKDEAVEHAEEAARHRGTDEQVLFTLGKVYLAADRPLDAEKTFEHICEVVRSSASCPYGLALVAAQKDDDARALSKLREAIGLKIPHPEKLGDDPAL
ncbi:MAG TPA: tetratricopeptide repeat protein, partial [Polyangiaceae bacterium]|nr:tetratricopeptide repeat protein [Polyangiaceae bacterium]